MAERILAEMTASITELKANPMSILDYADGEPVAILNRNKPAFYCLPPALYESMMEALDDMSLNEMVRQRQGQKEIPVSLDDL